MAQSVTSGGHAWGEAEWQGAENSGNGDQNISPAAKKEIRLGCEIPQNKGKVWGNERGNVDLCLVG